MEKMRSPARMATSLRWILAQLFGGEAGFAKTVEDSCALVGGYRSATFPRFIKNLVNGVFNSWDAFSQLKSCAP